MFRLIHWSEVIRDEKWKEETIKNTSEQQFRTEFECEFLGSTNTLINPTKLRQLSYKDAIQLMRIICLRTNKDHVYFITCDVSRGTKNDNSAFVVMDVTRYYIVCCVI